MKRAYSTLLAGLLFAVVLAAQVTTGTISGVVSDSSGAILPGARIVIQNEETGVARNVQSDSAGRYSAPSLGVGKYRVTASMDGFQTELRNGIELTLGREALVNIRLSVGGVQQTVEVTGEAPLVDTTKSSVDYLVNSTTVHELPLNGRDLSQLVLLNPGVNVTELPHNPAFNYGYGKLFSIGGSRFTDNLFLLDGTDIGDFRDRVPSGPSGALAGTETVKEFEVKTGNFGASYGHALGGIVNAVSQSGTNAFHGNAFEYLRNDKFDSAKWEDNALGNSKPSFKRNQFGGAFGGPIKKDKTFFFAGYESFRQRLGITSTLNVPDANLRKGILPGQAQVTVSPKTAPYLALYPLPSPGGRNFGDGRAELVFVDPQSDNEDFGQIRADQQFSERDSFFGRFTIENAERTQADGFPPEATAVAGMKARLFTVSETHIFSPAMLNTFRAAFNRVYPGQVATYPNWPKELFSVPNQPIPPTIGVTGLGSLGGDSKPNFYGITNRFEVIDDVNLSRGSHGLQFGVSFQHMQFNMLQSERPQGEWTFNSVPNFLAGTPASYRGTPLTLGNFQRGFRQNFYGLYLQDDWKVSSRLTLNLGLRWEPASVPTEVNGLLANLRHIEDKSPTVGNPYFLNKTWTNFSPRIGFAWSPFSSGRTSIRGGFGIYYGRLDANVYWTPPARDGVFAPSYQTSNARDLSFFPSAVGVINSLKAGGSFGTAYGVTYDNLKPGNATQWNFTIQQQIASSTMVSVGYNGNRGRHASSLSNFNTPYGEFAGGSLRVPNGAGLVNPAFDAIMLIGGNTDSWYNGLQANLQQRMSKGLQFQVAYTWSKSLNEADGNESAGAIPNSGTMFYPHDPLVNKGLSGTDVPHVLVANYVYELPFGNGRRFLSGNGFVERYLLGGWDFNGIFTAKTGQPFNLTVGVPSGLTSLMTSRRPNAVAGVSPLIWGGPDSSKDPSGLSRYFDPTVGLALPSDTRALGNWGRMRMRGPGITTMDFGLSKTFPINERMRLKFRSEYFNMLNHPNFNNPSVSLYDSQGRAQRDAGTIRSTITSARQIQFGMKLEF